MIVMTNDKINFYSFVPFLCAELKENMRDQTNIYVIYIIMFYSYLSVSYEKWVLFQQ